MIEQLRRAGRWSSALGLFALVVMSPVVARAAIQPDTTGARLVLTWNAPAGAPRASLDLPPACADSARADTLYLCMVPGQDAPSFNGFTAELRLRPAPTDSIADHWLAKLPNGDLRPFEAWFAPDSSAEADSPFRVQGFGRMFSDVRGASVRLRLVYAVPETRAASVRSGRTYVLAAVIVTRPSKLDRACRQPFCVVWEKGTLAFQVGYEPTIERGERVVGLSAAAGQACAQWGRLAPRAWEPHR